jgi:hypothetical protein
MVWEQRCSWFLFALTMGGCVVAHEDDSDTESESGPTESSDSIHSTVETSVAPYVQVELVELEPALIYNDSTVTCAATWTASDGVEPQLSTAWLIGEEPITEGDSIDLAEHDVFPGAVVECRVTASSGTLSHALSAHAVVENRAPSVAPVEVTPDQARVGDSVVCSAVPVDPDGESLTISYAWSNGSYGDHLTIPSGSKAGDVLTCTVHAVDPGGLDVEESADVLVLNSPPSWVVVPVSLSAEGYMPLEETISATDVNDDPLSFTIASLGTASGLTLIDHEDGSATLNWIPTFAQEGTHAVVVRVSDGHTHVDSTVSITVDPMPTFDSCAAVREHPGGLPSGIYWIVDPALTNPLPRYPAWCDTSGEYASCSDAFAEGRTEDGFYDLNGEDLVCRLDVDGRHFRACMFRQTDQQDAFFCGGVSASRWLVSDASGRTFEAWADESMTWPEDDEYERTFDASWRQLTPAVSPTISGEDTFCLSSRTYLTSSAGYAPFGKFSFADPGSADEAWSHGCVTMGDAGQYFGGHAPNTGERRYLSGTWGTLIGSWDLSVTGGGVLRYTSFYFED